ncbi:MAG: T9SS type A sorting domain-containing protein [Bacteroidetes bacterium]|nr:T9SS type A sorting domain-containing protein [Bacteroidota bacterium]
MKKGLLLFLLTCTSSVFAQQIVFTALNNSVQEYWKVNTALPAVYTKISDSLDAHASYAGKHQGPISISHTGNYYVFQSERFATDIDGYEAITICKTDFTGFEVPRDGQGNAFHAEGIMQVSNDGKTIVFVQDGTHNRDIFKITKSGNVWTAVELTVSANTYTHYLSPYLSYDETKIIFEAANGTYPITAIQQIGINATGLVTVASTITVNSASQVKSPTYDSDGNIYFEAETDAERVWKIASGGGSPTVVKSSFTNDNSPITLPNGKIASLLYTSAHHIKIMNSDGTNDFMLTTGSGPVSDIEDIGISAGGSVSLGINLIEHDAFELIAFPNPMIETLTIGLNNIENSALISVSNCMGQIVFQQQLIQLQTEINVANLNSGLYFITVSQGKETSVQKIVKQ